MVKNRVRLTHDQFFDDYSLLSFKLNAMEFQLRLFQSTLVVFDGYNNCLYAFICHVPFRKRVQIFNDFFLLLLSLLTIVKLNSFQIDVSE